MEDYLTTRCSVMIDEEQSPELNSAAEPAVFRLVIGAALIGFGTLALLWVFNEIYVIITHGGPNSLVMRLVPKDPQERSVITPQGVLVLPEAIFVIFGYGIIAALYSVLASLGKGLLDGGVRLLNPDAVKLFRKLCLLTKKSKGRDKTEVAESKHWTR